jgi:hypothetical protein
MTGWVMIAVIQLILTTKWTSVYSTKMSVMEVDWRSKRPDWFYSNTILSVISAIVSLQHQLNATGILMTFGNLKKCSQCQPISSTPFHWKLMQYNWTFSHAHPSSIQYQSRYWAARFGLWSAVKQLTNRLPLPVPELFLTARRLRINTGNGSKIDNKVG